MFTLFSINSLGHFVKLWHSFLPFGILQGQSGS